MSAQVPFEFLQWGSFAAPFSKQPDLFTPTPESSKPAAGEGMARKREGIAKAEARDPSLADRVRGYLFDLAADGRAVDIDDARDYCDAHGLIAPSSGFWGAIFRPKDWECVGYAPSRRPQNHAHANRRWKLRRDGQLSRSGA